jgi:hypothetical protein
MSVSRRTNGRQARPRRVWPAVIVGVMAFAGQRLDAPSAQSIQARWEEVADTPSSQDLCSLANAYRPYLAEDPRSLEFLRWNTCKACKLVFEELPQRVAECVFKIFALNGSRIGEVRMLYFLKAKEVTGFQVLDARPDRAEGSCWGRCRPRRKKCDTGYDCRAGICEPATWHCTAGECVTRAALRGR